jgi:Sulfotransferase family
MPIAKLPLHVLGVGDFYHLLWWQRTLARRSVLTSWNETNRAIFIHIPKTAGTSVLSALGAPSVFDTHAPSRVYAHAYPDFYPGAYKFAFVRNPWDRFASSFHFMKHGTEWKMQQDWARRHIGNLDFAEFTYRLRNPLFRASVMAERFFWPQTFWLKGIGNASGVDEIFRFESIDSSTRSLCARFGIAAPIKTPHLRQVSKPDFRDLYDKEMTEIVGRLYRRDIAALGYEF